MSGMITDCGKKLSKLPRHDFRDHVFGLGVWENQIKSRIERNYFGLLAIHHYVYVAMYGKVKT